MMTTPFDANKVPDSITDPAIQARIRTEQRIAEQTVDALLAAGYTLGVYDGEEMTVENSNDKQAILGAMFSTDEDYLYAFVNASRWGWVRFVYGNDGWDVICDYTVNLEPVVGPITEANNEG
jgi:hypothetical protein